MKTDLVTSKLNEMALQIQELENKLIEFKKIEEQQKNLREQLYDAMSEYGKPKWEMPNGIKITLIENTEDEEVEEVKFNERRLKEDCEEIYNQYLEITKKTIKGRKGYIRIKLPKLED